MFLIQMLLSNLSGKVSDKKTLLFGNEFLKSILHFFYTVASYEDVTTNPLYDIMTNVLK